MAVRFRVRTLCLLLCLAVLLPCVSASAETTKITAFLLRLRESPSMKAAVLDAYPRGTVVTILAKGSEWTRVRVHGKTGYMLTSMLAYGRNYPANNSSKSTGSTTKSGKTGTTGSAAGGSTMYVMKGIRLYLREEASSDSAILGSFRGGTAVTVLKRGKYWTRVIVDGLEGFMGNDYLTDVKE